MVTLAITHQTTVTPSPSTVDALRHWSGPPIQGRTDSYGPSRSLDLGALRSSIGRRSERETIDSLLERASRGESGALVLSGEAGIGKTDLLDYAVERAVGFKVVRIAGIESEMELAFAALHQLCSPFVGGIDHLPEPQRAALQAAFGLSYEAAPDRFFTGLAVLTLLSEVAADRPVLCVIDDAQWLDLSSVQALAFVARRKQAESVAMLFAVRDPSEVLAVLPELPILGLTDAEARELLAKAVPVQLDELVCDRIIAESRGNALALLELSKGLTAAELAGGFGQPDSLPLPEKLENNFIQRLESLPPEARRLLLLAAAEPLGDPALLWRAAERLGIEAMAARDAERAGLLRVASKVTFRHPLVRTAVYKSAPVAERQVVHKALAEVTDAELDTDRRAWHHAQATTGPDDVVADELERSAGRARARGGFSSAAAFMRRSAELTVDRRRQEERRLEATRLLLNAGAPGAAAELLAGIAPELMDEPQLAQLHKARAELAFHTRRGADAPGLLLAAAQRAQRFDIAAARRTYLEALEAAFFAGRLAKPGIVEVAEAAQARPRSEGESGPRDILLDGLATLLTEGWAAGVPLLKRAMIAFRQEPELHWLRLAWSTAADLWDEESTYELAERQVRIARTSGALTQLPIALNHLAGMRVHDGEFAEAAALIHEATAIIEATGSAPITYGRMELAAWQGRAAETYALIETSSEEAKERGEGMVLTFAEYARAVLENGLGNYRAAFDAAKQASEQDELFSAWVLPELVEAGTRCGELSLASAAAARVSEQAAAAATDWAGGLEARCRALVTQDQTAERYYLEAIERLGRCRAAAQVARARLLYGEWLRRENRRTEAREQLRAAHDMFETMGAEAFAARAARELLATGEHARKRSAETAEQLTPQEVQIARLASEGLSNPEIGAQLFISPRTVEYHLHKVFAKLDISSRNQLHRALGGIGVA
jgi:DNA-binding CsgD family transcriptional regulator